MAEKYTTSTPIEERRRVRRHADAVLLEALVDTVGDAVLVDPRLVDTFLRALVLAGVNLDRLDAVLGEAVARSILEE